MKVNYLSKDIEDEDKIPENITIRTMQSDLARLKEISKRKPTETSKDLPNKMSEVNLKKELNDFYPKKPAEKTNKKSSFLNFHKKAAPPAQLPTEKSEKKSEAFQQQSSAKISFNNTEKKPNINITEKKEDAVEFSLRDQPLEKKKEDITTDNAAGSAAIGLEKKTKAKKSGKKIILIVLLIIILICLGLAFYNFFILQNENEKNIFPVEETKKPEEPKKEKPKSIIPKIPFISDFRKPVIPTVQSFIPIKEIFSFISSDKKFDLIAVLDSYLETLKEVPEIALIKIRDENKILDLDKLSQKINIEIPEEITDNLSKNNYALIFLNLENEHRLGLVAEVNGDNMEKIQKNARQWETAMIDDLKLLFLKTEIGFPSAANFQENTYKGVKIRYMNFSEPNVTIDYAFTDNKLILATSKENIYKIIDILKK